MPMKDVKTKEIIVEQLKKTPIVQIACEKASIARATFYRWRKTDKDFAQKVDKALSEGMCFFRELHGPDPKTSTPSFGLRALCASCYFDVNQGKKPEIKPLADDQKSKEEKRAALKKDSGWNFK